MGKRLLRTKWTYLPSFHIYHKLYNYFFIKGGVKSKIKSLFVLALLILPVIEASGSVDIYIVSVDVYPEEIYEGDQVKVMVTVGNTGDEKVEGLCVTLFVDEPANIVDEVLNVSIDANGEKQVTLYWVAEEGEHTLFVFADCKGIIDEVNEGNNVESFDVVVKKPTYPSFPPAREIAEWWNSDWHYRVPLAVSMIGERENFPYENKMVFCNINFSHLMEDHINKSQIGSFSKRTFHPGSIRVIEYELKDNKTWVPKRKVGREVLFSNDYDALDNANVTILWVMEGNVRPHERRYYYIYWDTVENGEKDGEFDNIYAGIKNAEFEDTRSTQWKNVTEGPVKWSLGYVEDPIEHDTCYGISASGLYGSGYLWANSYAKVYQNFKVPDEGKSYYILHAKVYMYSDLEDVTWKILIDGDAIESGYSTGGWIEISKNITSYLRNKAYVTISFKVEIPYTKIETEKQRVSAYFDACWIETPNIECGVMENMTHGWWGNIYGVKKEYIAGVDGKNYIDRIEVESVAKPKEVVAILYSPDNKIIKVSMPFPDPSFEEEKYTSLFFSNERTSNSRIQSNEYRSGSKAVELKLSNYEGKWPIQNRYVGKNDMAGLTQVITHEIPLSNIPSLFFWYKIEESSPKSYIAYTLLTVGTTPKTYKIYLSELVKDGEWHRFDIPKATLSSWRESGGKVRGLEIKLVANEEGAENTVYIDDLGYSFMPKNATDRTRWYINDFYEFKCDEKTGIWELSIKMTDASDYRIEIPVDLEVGSSTDLYVSNLEVPQLIKEGEIGKFDVYIKNIGVKDINGTEPINVSLVIYQEDGEYYRMNSSIVGLSVSETKKVEFEWRAKYGEEKYNGTWKVMAKVNEEGKIPECDLCNNWRYASFTVEPRPDLKIDMKDVLFKPSNPAENETFNISIIVHNVGYKNATAKLRVYKKEVGEQNFILLFNGSKEIFIERKSWEKIVLEWKEREGIYNIKVEVECKDEVNTADNVVIKDIKIGKENDYDPPVIESVRADPQIQKLGKYVNISATIFDNKTTIDRAYVSIGEKQYLMKRVSDMNVYYVNILLETVGYYRFFIRANDTSEAQNIAESEEREIRIVYDMEDIEGPIINVNPWATKQVLFGKVNISAGIEDVNGVKKVLIFIKKGDTEEEYEMKKGGGITYYYEKTCEKIGTYYFHIKAIDASVNSNYNTTQLFSFEVPEDYDSDGVPDFIEINIGGNPKDSNDTIDVSIGNESGYLVWAEEDSKYIYWDENENETRETKELDVDGDGVKDYLFDVDGDGVYDYYYNEVLKEVGIYKVSEEKEKVETIWIFPPLGLFVLICIAFIIIRKK